MTFSRWFNKPFFAFVLISILFTSCAKEKSILIPELQQGIVDLSKIDFTSNKPIPLNGEWEFYWKQFLDTNDFRDSSVSKSKSYYRVPLSWTEENDPANLGLGKFGYATYRSVILVGQSSNDLGLNIRSKGLSYKVFANGLLLAEAGKVGKDENTCIPESRSDLIPLTPVGGEIELIIQSSNFHNRNGGLDGEIIFGDLETLTTERQRNIWTDLFLAGAILMMGIYHIGLYVVRKKNYAPLLFAIFCLLLFIRILYSENIASEIPSIDWLIHRKIDYLTYYVSFGIFILYTSWVFRKDSSKAVAVISLFFSTIASLSVIVLPARIFTSMLFIYQGFSLIISLYLTYLMILAAIRKRSGAIVYLIGWLLFFASGFNDLLYFAGVIETVSLIPIGLFFFILCQALLLILQYERSFKINISLKDELNHINKNLETIVEERTNSLRIVNEDLADKNESITDSISYAKRIQAAILPRETAIKSILPESFSILKPRDIVSGDFYWFTHLKNTPRGPVSILVAADCTGHGVPGAFMSMSGSAFLNQIVDIQNIISPDKIALALNETISDTLRQNEEDGSNRDGMDAAICAIIHEEKIIEYAGANRPFVYVKNNEFVRIAPAKASLGGNQIAIGDHTFEKHTISYAEDSLSVYLFTDGYTDQFGGEENKKFGLPQLKKLIMNNVSKSFSLQANILDFTIEDWMKNSEEQQTDDILIMGFKIG